MIVDEECFYFGVSDDLEDEWLGYFLQKAESNKPFIETGKKPPSGG
jgi:hypothetical protein